MSHKLYRSTDVGALPLTGQAGSLLAILDALLPLHGWAKAYAATNVGAYRPGKGRRLYLQVDDTGTTSASVFGYEFMTSATVGTGRFPDARQAASANVVRKSSSADAVARPYWIVVGETFVYVFASISTTSLPDQPFVAVGGMFFGDLVDALPNDPWAVALIANDGVEQLGRVDSSLVAGATVPGGHWIARGAPGLPRPSSAWAVVVGAPASATCLGRWGNGQLMADSVSRAVDMGRIHLYEAVGGNRTYRRRGRLPAMWAPALDTSSGQALDTPWQGADPLKRSLRLLPVAAGAIQGAIAYREE